MGKRLPAKEEGKEGAVLYDEFLPHVLRQHEQVVEESVLDVDRGGVDG